MGARHVRRFDDAGEVLQLHRDERRTGTREEAVHRGRERRRVRRRDRRGRRRGHPGVGERAACLVIGEDLGVVPDEIRDAMGRYGLYHYKVMIFEKDGGRFRGPEGYPRRALATVTTHDLPTIAAYWASRDIALRGRLRLYPSEAIRAQVRAEREADRAALLTALAEAGVPAEAPAEAPAAPYAPALATAMHRFLARSGAALVAVQLEDLVGVVEPANVPGTYREYPNWRRKVPVPIEDLLERGDVADALRAIDQARR